MAKDARAEIARTDEAIKRWESRSTRAMNMLIKLRRHRARWERLACQEQERKKEERKRKQVLPPPPINSGRTKSGDMM